MKQALVINSWIGGYSSDTKHGIKHAFAYSRHVDFRKKSSTFSILPKTTKNTGSVVVDLPLNMIEVAGSYRYAVDRTGGVYQLDAGSWAKLSSDINTFQFGMGYVRHQDILYLTCDTTISSVTNAGGIYGSPTIDVDTLAASVDRSLSTSGNTYSSQSAINEGATHRQTFSPNSEPLYSIKLYVVTKGTGDVVVTLHDSANNTLGTVTKTAASLTNGQLNEWVFSSQIRLNVQPSGSEYHFHVTHPSGTATTFQTTTASDLETASFETWNYRLVDNVEHHMIEFLQYLCICNERYLAVWEPITTDPADSEFDRHRLTFPPGYQGVGLAVWQDYLAIATARWSNSSGGLSDGKIFFWDGTSSTYNFVVDVPEGAPQAIFSYQNALYWIAGGGWYTFSGGQPQKFWQFPNTDTEFKSLTGGTYVYPQMMTVRNGVLLSGFPNSTFDPAIEFGVYSFGSREKNYPSVPGYSYTISTGTRQHETEGVALMELGFVKSFGNDLYIGWGDYDGGTTYGIDKVASANAPFSEATLETLIIDNGRVDKRKQATEMEVTFEALPSGATVTPKYKIDRGAWVTGTAATEGDTSVRLNINKSYNEIQLGVDLVASSTTPVVTGMILIWDDLRQERD